MVDVLAPKPWPESGEMPCQTVSERYVWVVRYADWWPPLVDSFWADADGAEKRREWLEEYCTPRFWRVEVWHTDGSEPPAEWDQPSWEVPARSPLGELKSGVRKVWVYPTEGRSVGDYLKVYLVGVRRLMDNEAKKLSSWRLGEPFLWLPVRDDTHYGGK